MRTSIFTTLLVLIATLVFTDTASAVYHPGVGRFVQRDPLNQDHPGGGYQDGMNLYQYVRSNPVVGLDPLGLEEQIARSPAAPPHPNWELINRVVRNTHEHYTEETWAYRHANNPERHMSRRVRVPKPCTVVVELLHFSEGMFQRDPFFANPDASCTTRFGMVTCYGDFFNRGNPATITNWPTMNAPVGPGVGESFNLPATIRPIARQLGFSQERDDFNAGLGEGPQAWNQLLADVWGAAVQQGRDMAWDPYGQDLYPGVYGADNCKCETVKVVFLCPGKDAQRHGGIFDPQTGRGYCGRMLTIRAWSTENEHLSLGTIE